MRTVKIMAQGIQNLTDARFFAAWNVDWLAFGMDPMASDYLPPERITAIREWVEGPQIAGMTGLQSVAEIRYLVDTLQLDVLVLGMVVSLETLQELADLEIPVYKEVVLERDSNPADVAALVAECSPFVAGFILDFGKNGLDWRSLETGTPVSIAWTRELGKYGSMLLNLSAPADKYRQIAVLTGCTGFCLQGGEEEKVGFKSFDYLDEVLEQLEG